MPGDLSRTIRILVEKMPSKSQIPYAPFVDKVEDYVSSRTEVDGTMKSFQEMIS